MLIGEHASNASVALAPSHKGHTSAAAVGGLNCYAQHTFRLHITTSTSSSISVGGQSTPVFREKNIDAGSEVQRTLR